ncbi:pilus assembly PilX family protein [Psychromonas marina]|nr:PilX N-terminal domain-containing pilus assembly protein [Psychromonas marina]
MLKKQSGAVLVVSLIILIMLTVLVLSGTQSTVMQEKMTAAIRDSHISLEIAESGVRDAEKMIETLTGVSGFNAAGTGGKYSENDGPADLFDETIWADNLTSAATTTVSGHVSRYFVEYLGLMSLDEDLGSLNMTGYGETTGGGDIHGFKVVARSIGKDSNTERIIVSYYGKRF